MSRGIIVLPMDEIIGEFNRLKGEGKLEDGATLSDLIEALEDEVWQSDERIGLGPAAAQELTEDQIEWGVGVLTDALRPEQP